MITNQLLEQDIFGGFPFNQNGLQAHLNHQVAPSGNPQGIGVDRGGHVGMWTHEDGGHLGSFSQKLNVWVGLCQMPQEDAR